MLPPPCEFQKHNSQSWKVNWSSGLRLWPRWMIVNGDVIWCYKKVHWPFTDLSQSGRLCFWSLQTPRRLNIVTGCTCRGWMVTMWRDGVHPAFMATFRMLFMTPTCPSFWWCFFGIFVTFVIGSLLFALCPWWCFWIVVLQEHIAILLLDIC